MSKLRAYILCRFAVESGVYTSWMDDSPLSCEIVSDYLPDWPIPKDAGIIITHMHYRWEEIQTLRRVFEESRVPILVLSDGILEYRNSWEHPDLPDGAMFQPVIGHKLACIGRGQVRMVESWGNVGKCELVGLPRLDAATEHISPINTEGSFRLLIATASTPAFNEEQRAAVIESLSHIKERLEKNPRANGRLTEVTWRLTDDLENEIGVPMDGDPETRPSLSDAIDRSDAVITTPSTLYLESLLKKRPTAILDFHNAPQYVSGAWLINAPKHFNWILKELANPPPAKMLFQQAVLHDQLECATPAKPRLIELIREMVELGRLARAADQPVQMPARILADDQRGFARVESDFDLRTLYPENAAFKDSDVARLQVELAQAVKRLETVPRELNEKNKFLAQALSMLDRLRVRNARMHTYVVNLRERFGIKPANPRRQTNLMDKNGITAEKSVPLAEELGEATTPKTQTRD